MFQIARTVVFGAAALLSISLFFTPSPAQIQNPITAARDAYKKARQDQQQKQQPAPQQTRPQQTPQAAATPDPGAAAPGAAEPWTPPAETASAPVVLDPSKMPDVIGVRVGVTPQAALDTLRKQYPRDMYQKMTVDWWPSAQKPDYGYNLVSPEPGNSADAFLSFTAPPNPQLVWKITRYTWRMHINRVTLLNTLREKYGKETAAFTGGGAKVAADPSIEHLFWLFDERGGRIPLPPAAAFPNQSLWDCMYDLNGMGNPQPAMPVDDAELAKSMRGWCSSFVGVHIHIDAQEIVENTFTEMLDAPLAMRAAHAAKVWQRDLAERLRKEDLEKSKNVKPAF